LSQSSEESKGSLNSAQKANLRSETYPKDELDEEEFVWQEHPLKPGCARPVIIHRAILGSVERFSAILIEHIAGKWPFWISPRQAIIVPVSEKFLDYAEKVTLYLHQQGFEVELDRSNLTLAKKVRNGQISQWNYILVVGEKEQHSGHVDIRSREDKQIGNMRVDKCVEYFRGLLPKESNSYNNLYNKAWKPEDYPANGQQQVPV
jgi:threonyl-tRNA synthetase